MTTNFTVEEIYPNIFVYNNVFEDPDRMYQIVKDSLNNYNDAIWESWQDWYIFGEKVEKFGLNFDKTATELKITKDIEPTSKVQEDQRYFITELVKGFHLVNNDYIAKQNMSIPNEKDETVSSYGVDHPKWNWTGPSLCRYFIDSKGSEWNGGHLAMRYHSDYIREKIKSPGYKFVLTTTTYLNDDYTNGGVDFAIGNKLINYKPKAGDFLVFPSGHPDYLTEGKEVYLHAAENCQENEKFFTRMYWQVYEDASEEWKENEEKFGKEEWPDIFKQIQEDYMSEHPQRTVIEGAVRIR